MKIEYFEIARTNKYWKKKSKQYQIVNFVFLSRLLLIWISSGIWNERRTMQNKILIYIFLLVRAHKIQGNSIRELNWKHCVFPFFFFLCSFFCRYNILQSLNVVVRLYLYIYIWLCSRFGTVEPWHLDSL